ncbi:MAG: hypothetical protein CVT73_21325 [Alphaproteobacteria bacterium HGW-Alphaproteobacteria-12]|nr:MAG: hypothetical protein CVT73_21325 [Alphaproteobacteria bacterium HGW-Alphaproteobacteria-12]
MSNGNLRRRAVSLPPIALDAELDFNHPDLNEGLAYWREKAAGRAMPLLPDIHPEEIPRLLPYLSLFEIHRVAGTVEFFPRLAAPKMEDVFGPIHRKPLHTVLAPEISERWEGAARTMIEMGVPLRGAGEVLHEGKSFIAAELLLAPLSRTGEEIDMIFLLSHFDQPPPSA